MEIVVTGRHVQVTDRFRDLLDQRMAKVSSLAPKVHRVDVVITHERVAKGSECVEITCRGKGPVIRAEACADDKYAALDTAVDKLTERLKKASEKRRVSRRQRLDGLPPAVTEPPAVTQEEAQDAPNELFGAVGNSPIEVREKVHAAAPMTLEDALNQMEMLGHDFFLFHDRDTDRPSVVYRRRGWSYGVLHLENLPESPATSAG